MAYNHKKGLFWYNPENKIAMVSVPKNASVSLRNTFNLTEVDDYLINGDKYGNYNFITVIRDPLDRLASGYLEILVRATESQYPINITKNKKFFQMEESKDRFVEFINEIEIDTYDGHIEHQSYYITDNNDNMIPYYKIIRFENLSTDINDLIDELKLGNLKLLHENKKRNIDKNRVMSYLENDDNLVNRIKKIYEKDYQLIDKIINDKL